MCKLLLQNVFTPKVFVKKADKEKGSAVRLDIYTQNCLRTKLTRVEINFIQGV